MVPGNPPTMLSALLLATVQMYSVAPLVAVLFLSLRTVLSTLSCMTQENRGPVRYSGGTRW